MGLTGEVAGGVRLVPLPNLSALLELDEMSFAEFGKSLRAEEFQETVMIRPVEELRSSSLLDEAVLEDTKKVLSARSGSAILKDPRIRTTLW